MSRLLVLFVFAVLVAAGCSSRPEVSDILPENEADKAVMNDGAGIETLEDARKVYINLKTRAEAAEARVKVMEEQAQAERMEALKSTCWWVAGIAFFAALICIAAAFFLETARKLLLTGAGACFGIMILSIMVSYSLPYVATAAPFVAIGIGLLGLVGAIWYFLRLARVKAEHVQVGVEALYQLRAVDIDKAKAIKAKARERQKEHHLYNEISGAVRKVKRLNGFHDPPKEVA